MRIAQVIGKCELPVLTIPSYLVREVLDGGQDASVPTIQMIVLFVVESVMHLTRA
jgi:hypothetical protein